MAEDTATFSLRIDSDASAVKEDTAELEKFKNTMQRSMGAVADYRKSLSLLKGSSQEVTDAKARLKAAIDVEKGKISQANLAILKMGSSYDRLAKASKKSTGETGLGSKAFKAAGGPMAALAEKFEGLQSLLPVVASGWGAVALGVGAAIAGFTLAAASIGGLLVKFTEWLGVTADATRDMRLQREAFSGSALAADRWDQAITAARTSVALTRSELNAMSIEIEKSLHGAYINGQGLKDIFTATSLAAGAGRKDVAAFFTELVERGKQTGRTYIAFPDIAKFRNAGIDVKQLFKALGVSAQQAALGVGVSTEKMAAALAKLSASRFASMNQKKMLSLGNQWNLLKDNFSRFADELAGEGGALEPLLKGLQRLAVVFDMSQPEAKKLKQTITEYGTAISNAIVAHIPDIKAFVAQAITIAGAFISAAAAVIQWTQSANGATTIKAVLIAIGVTVGALAVAFGTLAAVAAAPFAILATAIYGVMKAVEWIKGIRWGEIGSGIIDGITAGLESAWTSLKDAVTHVGTGIKRAFMSALNMGSPSKDFAKYGRWSAEGYSLGLEQGQGDVTSSATAMAQEAKGAVAGSAPAGNGGGGGGGGIAHLEVVVNIAASAHAEEVRSIVSSQTFVEQLQAALRPILKAKGIPVTTVPASGG